MKPFTAAVLFFLSITMYAAYDSDAGELTYSPTIPSFGGSSLNAQWLMSEAQAQNEHEAKKDFSLPAADPLEDFKESLNRQILNRFANKIIQTAFGESKDTLSEGSFTIGDFMIDIKPLTSIIQIVISDKSKGTQTVIEVPYYQRQGAY